jgi:endonuclease/exonuclease/phosphatase family metal-dependent hydrolase
MSTIRIAHFSFANAQCDGQMKCSPQERLPAINQFFAWAAAQEIAVVGCTEGHRAQNGFSWAEWHREIEEKYGYQLIKTAILGDQSSMAFGSQLFLRRQSFLNGDVKTTTNQLTLTPSELDETRWAIRAPTLQLQDSVIKLIYCHLSLSRDGQDAAYDNLLYELRQLVPLIADGWIAFGDFNLTQETRARLTKEQPDLLAQLRFAFGAQPSDLSFVTFPHDRVPLCAFANAPDAILNQNEQGCNCVAPLDAVCGTSLVKQCQRFLPWAPFTEVPLDASIKDVVAQLSSEDGRPPADVCQWSSDHWILTFTCDY